MARFISFTDIFIAQLYNFWNLKANRLYVIRLIMYKPEFKKTWNVLQKNKDIYLYIAKYTYDFVSKDILSIRKFRFYQLKSSHLSSQKIFTFFFCNIDRFYYKKVPFIWSLLRICISIITDISLDKLLDFHKMSNIDNKIAIY